MPQTRTAPAQATAINGDTPNMIEASGPFVTALIHQAKMLEGELDVLRGKVGKNREQLRGLDELDALSPEQGEWLETFYPTKEKGDRRSDADIKATREAKEAARKYYKEHSK